MSFQRFPFSCLHSNVGLLFRRTNKKKSKPKWGYIFLSFRKKNMRLGPYGNVFVLMYFFFIIWVQSRPLELLYTKESVAQKTLKYTVLSTVLVFFNQKTCWYCLSEKFIVSWKFSGSGHAESVIFSVNHNILIIYSASKLLQNTYRIPHATKNGRSLNSSVHVSENWKLKQKDLLPFWVRTQVVKWPKKGGEKDVLDFSQRECRLKTLDRWAWGGNKINEGGGKRRSNFRQENVWESELLLM